MKVSTRATTDEACRPSTPAYAWAPPELSGGDEGRLHASLREVAKNPLLALAEATYAAATAGGSSSIQDHVWARAYTEMAVTGSVSHAVYRTLDRSKAADQIVALARLRHPGLPDDAQSKPWAERALAYADAVSLALRAKTAAARSEARAAVRSFTSSPPRYVAVSGEDDLPDRPVNQPCSRHLVDDLLVPVKARGVPASRYPKVRVRYARTEGFRDSARPLVIFLHGLGSRLEENDEVMAILDKEGFACVAMDLPNQGYSQRVPFSLAGVADEMLHTAAGIGGPFYALELYDAFVRSFVPALAAAFPEAEVEERIALVAGGSQGGTLTLRLGQAPPPWLPRIAAWSSGCVWESFWGDDGWHWLAVGNHGPLKQVRRPEDVACRRDYMHGLFEERFPTSLFFGRIADTWWRGTAGYASCKEANIKAARAGRHEVYDEWHRRWCSAMEQDQLAFGLTGPDSAPQWPFNRIELPLLLIAGEQDRFQFANIASASLRLAQKAAEVGAPRGNMVRLPLTGHSIHDERPALLAELLLEHLRAPSLELESALEPALEPAQADPIESFPMLESAMPDEIHYSSPTAEKEFGSVSNSVSHHEAALESLVEAPPPLVTPGSMGGAGSEPGLSAKKLIVSGFGSVAHEGSARGALESVIGIDERQRILDTEAYPWRMVCALRIVGANGAVGVGTGWLAGPRTVITAGHCVFHPQLGGWARHIEITPACDGASAPFGTIVGTRFATTHAWLSSLSVDHDYAVIHLDAAAEEITGKVGWFSTAAMSDEELLHRRVNVSGYPGDKGGRQHWHDAKQLTYITPLRLFYDIDTAAGQSGAPVWIWEDTTKPPLVLGVHAYGVGATPASFGVTANSAPRINSDVFKRIQDWIAEDSGS